MMCLVCHSVSRLRAVRCGVSGLSPCVSRLRAVRCGVSGLSQCVMSESCTFL